MVKEARFTKEKSPQVLPETLPWKDFQLGAMPEALTQIEEEKQVIVHCSFMAVPGAMIRIWPTTYLIPKNGGGKIPLAHAENISFAPRWTVFEGMGFFTFTLIFKGLPSDCMFFDLEEEAQTSEKEELNLFSVSDIERNETDVYHIWI